MDYDLSPEDRAFVALITNAIDTCDTEELMRLKKEVLVLLNKEAKLPYSNRNKEELIQQLTEWKGCWCNLREVANGAASVCRFMSATAVGAIVAGAIIKNTLDEYTWSHWWTGRTMNYDRDTSNIVNGLKTGVGAGVAAAVATGVLVRKRREKGKSVIKEAYDQDQY
jgi:hypothetical protein